MESQDSLRSKHLYLVYPVVLLCAWILMWPLVFLYLFSSQKKNILKDIDKNMSFRNASFSGINALVYLLLLDKFFRTLFYYRIKSLSLLVRWLWRPHNSFSVTSGTIGGGIFCVHPTSTYLNACKIGVNFSCRNNTTIGNKLDTRPQERPTIGDNVTVGANVVVIGDINIGNNVTIGAGSVVVKDIPDNTIVAGNPAKIIRYV